jgi:hypothetical protein
LDLAREVVEEDGWCQGHFAETLYGDGVNWDDKDAAKFCLIGSIRYAAFLCAGGHAGNARFYQYWDDARASEEQVVQTLEDMGHYSYTKKLLAVYNDAPHRNADDVVSVLDATIERIESEVE